MPLGGAPLCPTCGERVYFSEEKTFMSRSWHKRCFKCDQCSKALESTSANLQDEQLPDSGLICNACVRSQQQGRSSSSSAQPAAGRQPYVNRDDPECCPRCGQRVYFAEQLLSLNRKWHKACFTCGSCSKKVEVAQAADHGGELYCRACHGRQFGPKGYGFAGGAGTGLSMDTGRAGQVPTDNIPQTAQAYVAPVANKENSAMNSESRPTWGGGEYCPRCSKQVFIAERRQAAGHAYHTPCFTCRLCNKKLDASMLTEKQEDIYCKTCYAKEFAPTSIGFGVHLS